MNESQKKTVDEKLARMNTVAVIQRLEMFETRFADLYEKLAQAHMRITQLQAQMALQQQLATQISNFGKGRTT